MTPHDSHGWTGLKSHRCETTEKVVKLIIGWGGLIDAKCDKPCDHHECRYNAAQPSPNSPERPPDEDQAAQPPTKAIEEHQLEEQPAQPPESKTSPRPIIEKEKPKKCKVKPPKKANPYSSFMRTAARSEDLLIVHDSVTCPKTNTLVPVQSCRNGCGAPYISIIRHSGTKIPHLRCGAAKGVTSGVKEGALA